MSIVHKIALFVSSYVVSLTTFCMSCDICVPAPAKQPCLSTTVKPIASDIKKNSPFVSFFLIRHGTTTMNLDGEEIIQGNSAEGSLIITKELMTTCNTFANVFDRLYSNESGRAHLTMQCIDGNVIGDKCEKDARFNEQSLGCLEGQPKTKVLTDSEFAKMLQNPQYKISCKEGQVSESGYEVINRMLAGFKDIAHHHIGKTIGVCSSQCAMNWFFRWASQDFSRVLQISNLAVILFRYYVDSDEIQLLSPQGAISSEDAVRMHRSLSGTL